MSKFSNSSLLLCYLYRWQLSFYIRQKSRVGIQIVLNPFCEYYYQNYLDSLQSSYLARVFSYSQ